MFSRSLRSPVVRGFGAAAILILSASPSAVGVGATPSQAETLAASAAASAITAPQFSLSATEAGPGQTLEASVRIAAKSGTAKQVVMRMTAKPESTIVEPTCFPDEAKVGYCALGDITSKGQSVPIKVHIPKTAQPGSKIVVNALAEAADGSKITAKSPAITVQDEEPTPTAELGVKFTPAKGKAVAGTNEEVTVEVEATSGVAGNAKLALGTKPKATIAPSCVVDDNDDCILGNVGLTGRSVKVTVAVPASMGKGKLTLMAYATADNSLKTDLVKSSIAVSRPSGGGTGGGSGGSGGSGGTGGSTGTGSGSGTGIGGSYPNPPTGIGTAPPGTPGLPGPNANGQQPLLPEVAPPTGPAGGTVAPHTKTAKLVAGGPAAQEEEFSRLVSVQAAWLAALLVAFTLLLVHARMGKLRLAATQRLLPKPRTGGTGTGDQTAAATAAGSAAGGAHRRPRRLFGRSKGD